MNKHLENLRLEEFIDMMRDEAKHKGLLLELEHEAQRLIYIDSKERKVTTFRRYQAYGKAFRLLCKVESLITPKLLPTIFMSEIIEF